MVEHPTPQDREIAVQLAKDVTLVNAPPRPQRWIPSLPPTMWLSARQCAATFLLNGEWVDHLLLCLLLVQARCPEMEREEIELRLELESILMNLLWG